MLLFPQNPRHKFTLPEATSAVQPWRKLVHEHQFTHVPLYAQAIAHNYLE